MENLKVFDSSEFGEIRTIMINGEPWFVASDICKALEIVNTTQAVQRLDSDEKSMFNIGLSGGDTNCVNEYGLYNLVMASRKESAKQFKRWITHEVLPQIRQTGSYSPIDRSQLSQQTQALLGLIETQAMQEIEQKRQAQQLERIEERVDNMKSIMVEPIGDWRTEINRKVREISISANIAYQALYDTLYSELETTAHCSLKRLQDNKVDRMTKAGNTKTAIKNETTKIAIIEDKPQLKAIFENIVKRYAMSYCV